MEKKKKDRLVIAILILAAVILVLAGFASELNYVLGGGYREDRMEAHEEMMNLFEQKIKESEKHGQAQMMDYLEKRYHEKFVMKSYEHRGNGIKYSEMEVWPEGKEDDRHLFSVFRFRGKDGNIDFNDTYVYVKLRKEFLNYYSLVTDKYFDEYYSDMTGPLIANERNKEQKKLKPDITVEELLTEDYSTQTLVIYLKPDQKPDIDHMVAFCREMRSKKFLGDVSILITRDEKTFQAVSSETYKFQYEDASDRFSFHIRDDHISMYKDGGTKEWD